MEFWGVRVKANQPLEMVVGEGELVHINQASLDFNGYENDTAILSVTVGDSGKIILGSLSKEKTGQMNLDLNIKQSFTLLHTHRRGQVHFTGSRISKK